MANQKIHSANSDAHPHVLRDLGIIVINVVLAIYMAETGIVNKILDYSSNLGVISIFIAGMLFTSVFTVAPASVVLFQMSQTSPVVIVAFIGALGALLGDMLIFKFVRDSLSEDIIAIFKRFNRKNRFKFLLKLSYLRWLVVFLGGLIIASPLPDELGLMLMGFSKLDSKLFALLSFFFNLLGIALIGYFARVV